MKIITAAEIRERAEDLAPLESQKAYRECISEFIRMHRARVEALDSGISPAALPGNSMLIIAQTGCGKSFTATRLAAAADVDLITIDCSSLTRSGYKGCNLGDLLRSACKAASDKTRFERSILLFDEVDKLRLDGMEGNPQANLLKLFDGMMQTEPKGSGDRGELDVSRMSFLFAGAFAGLEDIIHRRLTPRSIGFCSAAAEQREEGDLLEQATMADIRDYGFMDELLGRMGTLFYIPPLSPADYRLLLKGTKGSVCRRYNNLLSPFGVTLEISDGACAYIAARAAKSALGARAVDPMVYELLRGALSRVDADGTINRVTLTCRSGGLALRFGHGERHRQEQREEEAAAVALPDVNLSPYLSGEDDIRDLCCMALNVAGLVCSTGEKIALAAFLNCTFLFMRTLGENDKALRSLTKLADCTAQENGRNTTVYDRIIQDAIRKSSDQEFKEELQQAYDIFRELQTENTRNFLVDSIRRLRRNWYRGLMEAA